MKFRTHGMVRWRESLPYVCRRASSKILRLLVSGRLLNWHASENCCRVLCMYMPQYVHYCTAVMRGSMMQMEAKKWRHISRVICVVGMLCQSHVEIVGSALCWWTAVRGVAARPFANTRHTSIWSRAASNRRGAACMLATLG